MVCAIGLLGAVSIPAEQLVPCHPVARGWMVTLCFLILMFLPCLLPAVLTPHFGTQRTIRKTLYVLLALLLIGNVLF